MAHWKFGDDACSSRRLEFGDGSPEHCESMVMRVEAKAVVDGLGGAVGSMPGSTAFANITMQFVYRLHGEQITDATKRAYKRLSETAHGGLYGLFGDKQEDPETGDYSFVQDDDDLDAIAQLVGIWWFATTPLVASAHGWDWANEFGDWGQRMRQLFG